MLGLPRGEVFLSSWTAEWEREFESEKERIKNKISDYTIAIHHIGSTAVRNLSAKPIIDIALEIIDFSKGKYCVQPLEEIGYSYRGTEILPDRHYFNKGEPRTHQIHMYQTGSKYLQEQLKFRDFLRDNEYARIEYETLKLNLSRLHKHNKHQYADAKTDFIRSILDRIL